MNILYIGSSGALSLQPFRSLMTSGHRVVAVGVYRPVILHDRIIALENESLALAATQRDIPVIDLSGSIDAVRERCDGLCIDVILMSCYARHLPRQIVDLAVYGGFNMHPSLLPRYRGPEPIFWQLKHGSDIGVSWHRIAEELDAGDVIVQQKICLHDGAGYTDISLLLARTGAKLMLDMLSTLNTGSLSASAQNPEQASYYDYPRADDFDIDTAWTARRAFNFMKATQLFGQCYSCRIGRKCFRLQQAVEFDDNSRIDKVMIKNDILYIPFSEGVLMAGCTDKIYT